MVVGFDPGRKEKSVSSVQCGLCGSVSGVLTRLVVQPLDVLKIRFQLQVEPTTKQTITGKYSGIWQAFKLIYKEEGYAALWKGHVPAQVLSMVYGYVQFMSFEAITEVMWKTYPASTGPKWKPVTHFVSGGLAGCLSSTVAQPLDVLRTRLVAQGEPKIYKSLYEAASKMYVNEGIQSFYKVDCSQISSERIITPLGSEEVFVYVARVITVSLQEVSIGRGLVPTLVQIFPYAGLQFGFYAFFKALWEMSFRTKQQDPYKPADIEESLACGALSGIVSKGIIYPLDMVKKRLQVQGFHEARQTFGEVRRYSGMLDCFRVILREEGSAGFFKGLAPSTIKAGLSVAIIFCTYEQCLQIARGYIHEEDVPATTSTSLS
ncbi:hypothetical protein ACROYT_G002780 [Oculina patagonica]